MKVLIVEDEALLAMELEYEVEAAGHEVVAQAASLGAAINAVEKTRVDLALVDIQLLDGPTGVDVGRHLFASGIPYAFVSGNLKRIPEDFAGAIGAIEKPYTSNGIQNALRFLSDYINGDKAALPPPSLALVRKDHPTSTTPCRERSQAG
ncbi:response regulator [Pseudorhizobium endolithicum]|uniref:Response regulator n=1 Tax=Pseudorhizobium endolithicum TaxID=1191678 RepID=A0ABN7JKH4_9HYPH|nr:response regulator [Pseudorhizobium endolithicum]CAD7035156.1 response regulator [Pseudorhizobium endolithicum]